MKTRSTEAELQYLEKRLKQTEEKLRANEAALARIEEIEGIRRSVEKSVKDLVHHAKNGQRLAGGALATIATSVVSELSDLAEQQPQMFLPLSRNVFAWPALVSRKRWFTEDNKKLLAKLQVGKGGIFSEREWQIGAPSTRLVMSMLDLARDLAAYGHLPRLTKKTKRAWFDKSWEIFLWAGWKPEEDDRVGSLGKSKAAKKPKYCKTLHPATKRANARAAIKAKLWQVFDALVAAK